MALDTYANLQTAIAAWLDRPDDTELVASIPDMITMAEADMNRRMRHWRMQERATTPVAARYIQLPANWLETYRFTLSSDNEARPLRLVGVQEMHDTRRFNANATGEPTMYAVVGGEIEVYPTPSASYTGELVYYERIPALSATNPTNWVLSYFPDCYLYGSLVHSAGFLQEDERANTWASLYAAAVDVVNREDQGSRLSGSSLVMRRRAK